MSNGFGGFQLEPGVCPVCNELPPPNGMFLKVKSPVVKLKLPVSWNVDRDVDFWFIFRFRFRLQSKFDGEINVQSPIRLMICPRTDKHPDKGLYVKIEFLSPLVIPMSPESLKMERK